MTEKELIDAAITARKSAYCPYSHMAVGAALLAKSGKVYTGANMENASFTPTVCAERVAFFSAIMAGEREFVRIAVVGGPEGEEPLREFPPCGVCRQVMSEFCGEDFEILIATRDSYHRLTLPEILPFRFNESYF
ncbi:MAG TPA: cytidine deaminase [Clostridiales bacterium]|nr:cytidine deaminase [Clostridiales bacterium]